MSKINKWFEIIKVADIHVKRIEGAIQHIGGLFPVDAKTMAKISEDDIAWIELLVSRFGKLQDLLGNKIVDMFLEQQGESVEHLSMVDKINKLEKLGILENAELWQEMRETRNHIAHEYPDEPELMAKYLNKIFNLTPKLLSLLVAIKAKFADSGQAL